MRGGDGKVIRVGDWVRFNGSYGEVSFAEVLQVGTRAAHIYIRVMNTNETTIFLTTRATRVVKSSEGEVMLWKLENE